MGPVTNQTPAPPSIYQNPPTPSSGTPSSFTSFYLIFITLAFIILLLFMAKPNLLPQKFRPPPANQNTGLPISLNDPNYANVVLSYNLSGKVGSVKVESSQSAKLVVKTEGLNSADYSFDLPPGTSVTRIDGTATTLQELKGGEPIRMFVEQEAAGPLVGTQINLLR